MAEPSAQPPKPRGVLTVTLLIVGVLVIALIALREGGGLQRPVAYSEFLEHLREGRVEKFSLGSEAITVTPAKGAGEGRYTVHYPGARLTDEISRQIIEITERYNESARLANANGGAKVITVYDGAPAPGFLAQMLPMLLMFLLIGFLFWFFVIRRMGQGGGVLSFGKSRAQLITKGKTGKTFKDVAGIDEAREEVEELVAFLKNPRKFQKLGGRIPRGVLLVGPPGTGKTLLAKAIAGEADVPFYSISGSDFVEMFVGVGASRVRDLFAQAKENAPCIIFIDEIDAVGRRRGTGIASGGHDEREQTLNAILVEMDGFSSTDKVIVIAATNRVDVLDPALLRPGRFDRHIHVSLPDIAGREQILQVHASKVKLAADVDLSVIARGTPGFSGADLESLINEAALHAARHDQEAVTMRDLEYARDRVAFGREKKSGSRAMPERERIITAYHEAGHALLQVLVEEADELHKVTIIPRGRALGATMHLPAEDRHTHGRKKLLGDIAVLYGGRIAEELFCGDITTGAANDIERATAIARGMVYEWGMSERMGPIKYTESHDGLVGQEEVLAVSSVTRRELDEEVRRIIEQQYQLARRLIEENRDKLERIARALLEHETLDGAQVKQLIAGGTLPPRRPSLSGLAPLAGETGNRGSDAAAPVDGFRPQLA
ncbi:MAG: ATP-dependent zinc metalloprotease FtsH [Planctomycetota bacterium]|nr:ATP-dependent zinc metalloprotease FtsH [Planctomycetota bacterium]MCX8039888.1 ATP-dependent zinc metalloprotease FtsH [Planctomycetota bacterium]MDW8372153.1 ATP-dependent zinc metalloprotease FtsH [Planctomycetota bacterium]